MFSIIEHSFVISVMFVSIYFLPFILAFCLEIIIVDLLVYWHKVSCVEFSRGFIFMGLITCNLDGGSNRQWSGLASLYENCCC